jgi:hypothetical protein
MSGETASQGTQQMAQSDCFRLLDNLFLREQNPKNVDDAFKHFEENFGKFPCYASLKFRDLIL